MRGRTGNPSMVENTCIAKPAVIIFIVFYQPTFYAFFNIIFECEKGVEIKNYILAVFNLRLGK